MSWPNNFRFTLHPCFKFWIWIIQAKVMTQSYGVVLYRTPCILTIKQSCSPKDTCFWDFIFGGGITHRPYFGKLISHSKSPLVKTIFKTCHPCILFARSISPNVPWFESASLTPLSISYWSGRPHPRNCYLHIRIIQAWGSIFPRNLLGISWSAEDELAR